MGYVKLLTGEQAGAGNIGATVLVPADNVASVKDDGGDIIIRYFSGYELYFSLDGTGTQESVNAFIEAIDKANGISGKPVSLTLADNNEYVYEAAGFIVAWG